MDKRKARREKSKARPALVFSARRMGVSASWAEFHDTLAARTFTV